MRTRAVSNSRNCSCTSKCSARVGMCSAGKSGNTRLSLIDVHMALLSKVGGDETMIGLRGGRLLLGLICRECRGNSTTTQVCEKKTVGGTFRTGGAQFCI